MLSSLATGEGIAEIEAIIHTAGVTMLHEMVHLITRGDVIRAKLHPLHFNTNIQSHIDVIDQPCVLPPPPDRDYTNRDWPSWTLSQTNKAYGFTESQLLGLARSNLGLKNADNYAMFAVCIKFPGLKCVGKFVDAIAKRENIPFELAPEAVKQIQQNGSTLS